MQMGKQLLKITRHNSHLDKECSRKPPQHGNILVQNIKGLI